MSDTSTVRRYRPSSGTEGIAFMAYWCDLCRCDEAFRRDEGDSCPIAANTMALDLHDPAYPAEWVVDDLGPRCTAFEPLEDTGRVRDVRQAEMAL
jgi:hypothetical protein